MKERLALNAVSGVGALVISIVIAFVLTPVIVSSLGDRNYGVWEVILVLVGYVGLIDLGLSPALVRFFAYESARGEPGAVSRVLTSSLTTLAASGLLCFAFLLALSVWAGAAVGVSPGEVPELARVLVIVGLTLAIKLPGTVLTAYLLGTQQHWLFNSIRSCFSIAEAIAIGYALTQSSYPGLVVLATVSFLSNLAQHAVFAAILFGREELRLRREHFSWETTRELYSFGAKSMLGLLALRLQVQALPLVIAHVIGVERVVFFVLARRLAEYAARFGVTAARPLTPYWSDLYGRGDVARIKAAWFMTSRLLQFVYCGLAIGIGMLGPAFIGAWIGPTYGEECRPIVWLTAVVLWFEGLAPSSFQVLTGMGNHGRAGVLLLGAAVVGIALAIVLGMGYDLVGVATAYAATSAVSSIGVMVLACSAIGISVGRHLRETLWILLIPMALEFACLLGVSEAWGPPDGYVSLLAHALLGGVIYAAAWWVLTLSPEERNTLLELIPLRSRGA